MPETGIGVTITGKEIYESVVLIKDTVTRIETKLDNLEVQVSEHDEKIEELQKFKYQIASLGGIVGGALVALIQGLFGFLAK